MIYTETFPTLDALQRFAKRLAVQLNPGMVVTLSGPLGVGKTTFVQAIGHALGIQGRMVSPTFTILKIYPYSQGRLLHMDAYRLEGTAAIGLEEESGPDTLTFIEWPERLSQLPEGERISIVLSMDAAMVRTLTLTTDAKVTFQ